MLDLLIMLVVFVIAIIIILISADVFVDNIVIIGTTLDISQIILGVTASAIGTSLPEFGSALIASLQGEPELGIGVVVGANIWNVLGILGITAVIAGVVKSDEISVNRDGVMALITGLIFITFITYGYFFSDKTISFIASIVMIFTYVYYLKILVKNENISNFKDFDKLNENSNQDENKTSIECDEELKTDNHDSNNVCEIQSFDKDNKKKLNLKNVFLAIISLAGLAIGCEALVWSIKYFGEHFHVPELTMGLFVLALFTTIPELFVTLTSAIKGLHNFSLGTVFGSCVFNILIGLGVPALFVKIPIEIESILFDFPMMVGAIVLTIVLMKFNGFKLVRSYGIVFLLLYLVYVFIRVIFVPTLGFDEIYFP